MAQEVKFIKVYEMADYAVVHWKDNGHYQYVGCWAPRVRNGYSDTWDKPIRACEGYELNAYWGNGHYFTDLEDAIAYANEKEAEAVEYRIAELREYLNTLTEKEDESEEEETEDEYAETGNMACDNTGFCSGSACPIYFECHGIH